jgi:hypothetical protein
MCRQRNTSHAAGGAGIISQSTKARSQTLRQAASDLGPHQSHSREQGFRQYPAKCVDGGVEIGLAALPNPAGLCTVSGTVP